MNCSKCDAKMFVLFFSAECPMCDADGVVAYVIHPRGLPVESRTRFLLKTEDVAWGFLRHTGAQLEDYYVIEVRVLTPIDWKDTSYPDMSARPHEVNFGDCIKVITRPEAES